MEEQNYFEENNKFLSMCGILGRRDFIVNYLIIEVIECLIFSTPFVYLLLFNPTLMGELTQNAYPMWLLIWICISGLISTALLFPSIVRRVRDIIGETDNNRIYLVSSVLAVMIFAVYTPVGANFWSKVISTFVIISLLCTKGKITSQKPANPLFKFNWGAFLGTWIWGLFNKAPKTIFMLPLLLTTGWFPFMFICGIRGNEWAVKQDKTEDLENFHKKQKTQATIWAIIAPILLVVGFFAMTITSGVAVYNYGKAHPEFKDKLINVTNEYQDVAIKSNFTKIDLQKDSYNFYIEPEIWNKLSDRYKKQMFNMAANYVDSKNSTTEEQIKQREKYPINVETMNKTKIYSSFNNEILAEYYINPDEYSKGLEKAKSLSEILTLTNSGYKINSHPSMP